MRPVILVAAANEEIVAALRPLVALDTIEVIEPPSSVLPPAVLVGETLQRARVDLVVVAAASGSSAAALDAARQIRRRHPHLPLVFATPDPSEELAIAAFRAGVNDYVRPPLSSDALSASFARCLRPAAEGDVRAARSEPSPMVDGHRMVGASTAMDAVKAYIGKVASTDVNVLITGETGTGKELAAELLHANSRRHRGPFVAINCAALPETLLESELFGYERGAFTGAFTSREGKFQLADGGTLFLDEIGDMSPSAQAKILRIVETRQVYRLGGRRSTALDVRVVTATNHDLEQAVAAGCFRKDLYFRLNIARIHLPPLREHKEDLLPLFTHFLAMLNARVGGAIEGFTDDALDCLLRYSWPGNVREVRNVLEVGFVARASGKLTLDDLPEPIRECMQRAAALSMSERERLLSALFATNWNKSKAAQRLNWSRMTLYRKLAKYELSRGPCTGAPE